MSEDPTPYVTRNLKKGTYVTRAAYSKLQGENKRLKKDIYILCHEKHSYTADRALVLMKWRDKYKHDEEFIAMLKQVARKHIADNPDSFVARIIREFPPKEKK